MAEESDPELAQRARRGDVRAQVRLGLLLEQAGRADEGLDWLARAARTDDVEALTLVGQRLVSGPHAQFLAPRGLELLAEAAARGGGDAAAQLAVLRGAGIRIGQDWTIALDWLQRAADLGQARARGQLAVLAGGPTGKAASAASSDRWRRMRESVDINAWARPSRPAEVLHEEPLVCCFRTFAPPRACAWIIEQSRPRLQQAQVIDAATGAFVSSADRNNRAANFGVCDSDLVFLLIQARIASAAGTDLTMMEAASVLCYARGEQAHEHFDFLDPAVPAYQREIRQGGQRIATCLVYLNDDYEGGTTDFPRLHVSHKASRGDALLFRNVDHAGKPEPRSLHAGRPPIAGEKWVLSTFIRDRRRIP